MRCLTSRKHTGVLLILFFSTFLLYNANLRLVRASDSIPTSLIPFSILIHKTLNLDFFSIYYSQRSSSLPYFLTEKNGHIHSIYPFTLPLIITPLYAPVVCALKVATWAPDKIVQLAAIMEKLVASLLASLSVVLLYVMLGRLTSRKDALILSLLYALATSTWSISSQALWQHGASQVFIISSLLCAESYFRQRRAGSVALAGLLAALAVAIRPTNLAFLLALLVALVFYKDRRKGVTLFILFPCLVGLLLALYNQYMFGDIRGIYAPHQFDTNLLAGIAGVLVSPSRGIFIYSPLLIFIFLGMYTWYKGQRLFPTPIFVASLLFFVFQIVLISKYFAWWAGYCYGPRYFTETLPALMILMIPALTFVKKYRFVSYIFVILILFSVGVQIVGAFCYPRGNWNSQPVSVNEDQSRLWDWRDNQIIRTAKAGPSVESYQKLFKSLLSKQSQQNEFGVSYHLLDGARIKKAGSTALYRIAMTNESNMAWGADKKDEGLRGLSISYHWYTMEGRCIIWDGIRTPLPSPVPPGQTIEIDVQVKAPEQPNTYRLAIDLVQEGITWFSWNGADPLDLTVEVVPN